MKFAAVIIFILPICFTAVNCKVFFLDKCFITDLKLFAEQPRNNYSSHGQEIFLSSQMSKRGLDFTHSPIQKVRGVLS
jgi:hypothetical protein